MEAFFNRLLGLQVRKYPMQEALPGFPSPGQNPGLKYFAVLPITALSQDMAIGSHREPNGKSADARNQNPPRDTDVAPSKPR